MFNLRIKIKSSSIKIIKNLDLSDVETTLVACN